MLCNKNVMLQLNFFCPSIVLYNRIYKRIFPSTKHFDNTSAFRDEPNAIDMKKCFEHMVAIDGRVLAIFTSFALKYYNKKGQFSKAMGVQNVGRICDEIFWPETQHIFQVEIHRNRLIMAISEWCTVNLYNFRKMASK